MEECAYTLEEGGKWHDFIPSFERFTFERKLEEWSNINTRCPTLSIVLVEDIYGRIHRAAAVRFPSGEIYDPILVALGEDGWDRVPVCAGTQQEK